MGHTSTKRGRVMQIVKVASGNCLEQYDFFVYGYYAAYIARTFFPTGDDATSLMLSFATFGAGFLMRPLGAIFLGSYIDRVGRRQGLIVTLGIMAIGTLTIAITPSYEKLGLLAPLIVLVGRLLQGFSAGAESGGVSVYLAEIASPGSRGFVTSWQSASQQVAVVIAATIGLTLQSALSPEQMNEWGWRVPLLIGCLIIPVILWLRRSLPETEAYLHMEHKAHSVSESLGQLQQSWAPILTGMAMSVMTTTTFYMITAYTPTFGERALGLSPQDVLLVTIMVGVSNFLWLPIGGALSDRIGRTPILMTVPIAVLCGAYPLMSWLVAAPTFGALATVLLTFSACFGIYNGALIARLTEIMPPTARTLSFSLAFSLATSLFGGFTPLISTALIQKTGNNSAPAIWLCFAAAISLAGVAASRRLERGIDGEAA
ncbi:MFS transporter [Sphingopyxis granuli]|uniref:MFS transporter n=1 Tax=Sphingopyxis granuli TaxID=267128 RepID=UPI00301CF3CA